MTTTNINPNALITLWANPDMGQSVRADAWLIGKMDPNAPTKAQIFQLWQDNGYESILAYGLDGQGPGLKPLGPSSWGAITSRTNCYLIGNIGYTNPNDKYIEIIRMWKSSEKRYNNAATIYSWNTTTPHTAKVFDDIANFPDSTTWLTGDIDGDGKTEFIQIHDSGSKADIWGWTGEPFRGSFDQLQKNLTLSSAETMSWQIGDVNGDGKAEIIQLSKSGDLLGITVYGLAGTRVNGNLKVLWSGTNPYCGWPAVAFLIGDINGDGKDEIIQQWDTGSGLGTIVYGWGNSRMQTLSGNTFPGQQVETLAWQIGDINGDGKDEIIQQWHNSPLLTNTVFGWNNGGTEILWSGTNPYCGWGATAFLIGDINGDGKDEIIQQWDNNGRLGTIVYGTAAKGQKS